MYIYITYNVYIYIYIYVKFVQCLNDEKSKNDYVCDVKYITTYT